MSTASDEKIGRKPLLPPDEQFWKRYSPHHEFPLASVTSLFVHGLVLGILILGAIWYAFQRERDSNKPVIMDVVTAGGDLFNEGASGTPGLPGAEGKTEVGFSTSPANNQPEPNIDTAPELKKVLGPEFAVPEIEVADPMTDLDTSLAALGKEATAIQVTKPPVKPQIKMPGVGTPSRASTGKRPGSGGAGGGDGPGKGTRGKGPGLGGAGGKTRAQIFALRWDFQLHGNPKHHVDKLVAAGVILALPDPEGRILFIQDLRSRPVDMQPGNLQKFQDAVKWLNKEPGSLQGLAQELRLQVKGRPFVPQAVLIMLPKDREEKMAQAEAEYARKMGRAPEDIAKTIFDFELRSGLFEPKVLRADFRP